MATESPVAYRPATARDLAFVIKSWVRSYAADKRAGSMTRARLVAAIRGTIDDLLHQPTTRLMLAVNALAPDQIWGFVCFDVGRDFPVLHFVYVKSLFRECGIGSGLVARAREDKPGVIRYTFDTADRRHVVREGHFKPGLVRRLSVRQGVV